METYFLSLEIKSLPPSGNKVSKGRISRKAKLQWKDLILKATKGKVPKYPLTRAELRFIRCSNKMHDYDNLVHSFKFILDILVSLKILADDHWGVIGAPCYEQEYAERSQGKIKIFIASKQGETCHPF